MIRQTICALHFFLRIYFSLFLSLFLSVSLFPSNDFLRFFLPLISYISLSLSLFHDKAAQLRYVRLIRLSQKRRVNVKSASRSWIHTRSALDRSSRYTIYVCTYNHPSSISTEVSERKRVTRADRTFPECAFICQARAISNSVTCIRYRNSGPDDALDKIELILSIYRPIISRQCTMSVSATD